VGTLSGIGDIVAEEGKYHINCMVRFESDMPKPGQSVTKVNEMSRIISLVHVFDYKISARFLKLTY
jgi:hypothetical protein